MFTAQHYKVLAGVLHDSYKACKDNEAGWKLIYEEVYTPLVRTLKADNEKFDASKFSWAVATGEGI